MSKRLFIAILAAATLLMAGCKKEEPTSGLVGSWGWNETPQLVFNNDGSYKDTRWEGNVTGKWSLKGDKLTCTPNGEEAWDANIILTGGNAWLVLVYEDNQGGNKYRSFENFRKIGATVSSGKLTDGRWDATRSGYKPAKYEKSTDYTFCMVVKGNTVDLYVPAYGWHIQGTFTLTDGKMHINADDDHIWQAAYKTGDAEEGSIGWNAWGCPDEAYESTWDDTYGAMDAENFTIQSPYTWYTVNQILAMGEKRRPGDPSYENERYMFKYMIYDYGENLHDNAQAFLDFDLCVAANGTEAYGGAVGLSPWIYKR